VTRRLLAVVTAVLAAAAAVAVAVPAAASAAAGPPDSPEYWFDQWQVPALWAQGARGAGITIAEIDTGVNASIPALTANVLPGKDFGFPGNGQIDREESVFGHGTAMASIMVGQPAMLGITGLAPSAKLLPIAVPLNGTTDSDKQDQLGPAITWAADHGGKIISMSLGGGRKPSPGADPCPADEQQAIYHALRKGAIVVAASGNTGPTNNIVEDPGVCLGVISVGAVDRNGAVASFSARHPYLTLTAPGVAVASLSRTPGAAYSGDGTSQATAVASAVFALVWSKYPKLSGREIVARVLATLDRKSTTRDPAYGYGIINALRAVTATVPADAPNPVFAGADPFIARSLAFAAKQPPGPPPAVTGTHPTGRFAISSSPRLRAPMVLWGFAAASAGLVALVALGFVGRVGRRRRLASQFVPVPAAPQQTGPVFWREITGPPLAGPPTASPPPDGTAGVRHPAD
jgi:subtilisin family serine protease